MSLDLMPQRTSSIPAPPLTLERSPVNVRSVILGLIGVVLINALAPFNNSILNNTDIVSSFLPTGVLLLVMLFVILINAPLHRFAPRYAYSSGELAVALGMILVSCALPFVGLMRYLPGNLVSLFYYAAQRPDYAELLRSANLPDWLFPTVASKDIVQRGNDPVVQEFVGRAVTDSNTFTAHFRAVPWHAWLRPAIAWGIFLMGLFGSILCMMIILRRQWVDNERLQFPLATVYMSLIEAPAPGKMLNSVFGSGLFWLAFGVVAFIHLFNGLGTYYPRYVPHIPLAYNIADILTEEPWRYCDWDFQYQRIYFTIIGLAMFMQTRTALSLWGTFALLQIARMAMGMRQSGMNDAMQFDQLFGALIVFAGFILYIARHHLYAVLRQMFGPGRPDDPRGRYLPYRLVGWGFVVCQLILIAWLVAVGTTIFGALVIVGMLMLLLLVLARIVADTGMIYPLIQVPVSHPFDVAASSIPTLPRTGTTNYFLSRLFSGILTHDLRQSLPPYAQHAVVVADRAAYGGVTNWRKAVGLVGVLVLALVVAYLVSGAATLHIEYAYAATLDRSNASPINSFSSHSLARGVVMDPSVSYTTGGNRKVAHSRGLQIGIGAAITAVLGTLNLNVAGWPLHPVGFLLCHSWGLRNIWFSIFLGWLLKTLLVHFGGARMFTRAQPLFLGLIFGEVMAAAFWLVVSLALWFLGFEYRGVNLLP